MDKNYKELKAITLSYSSNVEKTFSFTDLVDELTENQLLHVHLILRFY